MRVVGGGAAARGASVCVRTLRRTHGTMVTANFVQIWRVGWRDLRQQHDVLNLLYEQVATNANTRLSHSPGLALGIPTVPSEQLQWVEAIETSIGARDAYATAVVMFVDDLFKRVHGAYKTVPGAQPLTAGLRGVALHRLFKAAGNNVRHYQEMMTSTRL